MKVLTTAQMREVDRRTTEWPPGIPGIILMENAGHRVVEFLERRCAPLAAHRIVVLCGKGNNGGDGMVVARQLYTRVRPAALHVVLFGSDDELRGEAAENVRMLHACGCPVLREIPAAARNSTLVVDLIIEAVLGVLGFVLSERYKRTRGVPPWRCPSAVWALVWFLFPLLGAIVYAIACFTTRPPAGPPGWTTGAQSWPGGAQGWGPGPGAPGQGPQGGWNVPPPGAWGQQPPQGWGAPSPGQRDAPPPGYQGAPPPGGWEAPPPPGTEFPGFQEQLSPGVAAGPGAPAGSSPAPPPAPGPRSWLADPSGRHELRYWDGTRFTEHVADAGKISIDPL